MKKLVMMVSLMLTVLLCAGGVKAAETEEAEQRTDLVWLNQVLQKSVKADKEHYLELDPADFPEEETVPAEEARAALVEGTSTKTGALRRILRSEPEDLRLMEIWLRQTGIPALMVNGSKEDGTEITMLVYYLSGVWYYYQPVTDEESEQEPGGELETYPETVLISEINPDADHNLWCRRTAYRIGEDSVAVAVPALTRYGSFYAPADLGGIPVTGWTADVQKGQTVFQKIKKVVIPEGWKEIPDYFGAGLINLQNVILPESVQKIGRSAFLGCGSLRKITWGSNVRIIEDSAFEGCGFSSITLPETVEDLGKRTFANCRKLSSIRIPGTVEKLPAYVLSGCSNLKSIEIPEGITSINDAALAGCGNLTTVVLPKTLTRITYNAFRDCYHLGTLRFTATEVPQIAASFFLPPQTVIEVPAAGSQAYRNLLSGIRCIRENDNLIRTW